MSEPTLTEVFGSGATQTASVITIQKADLASVGLTALAANTAESLFVAIILKAAQQLTEVGRTGDYVNRNVTVFSGGTDLPTQSGAVYRRDSMSVLLYKAESLSPIDPDDY